jgi:hypothetical protein
MPFRLRLLILLLTLLITVGCDQATKQIARDQLPRGETLPSGMTRCACTIARTAARS